MKEIYFKNKEVILTVLKVLLSLGAVYLIILLATPKPQIPLDYKHALDSLTRANAEIVAKQKKIDSVIASYQAQIYELDYAIGNIQVKKTEIHNHYQVLGDKVGKFTPTQVDSFFKARYSY